MEKNKCEIVSMRVFSTSSEIINILDSNDSLFQRSYRLINKGEKFNLWSVIEYVLINESIDSNVITFLNADDFKEEQLINIINIELAKHLQELYDKYKINNIASDTKNE